MKRRRARGRAEPTYERLIEEFVPWLIEAGFSPAKAKAHADVVRRLYRERGVNLLALTSEELLRFIGEVDRRLEELERQEAEDLADVDPDEPEH
jgi:hypothetical protein